MSRNNARKNNRFAMLQTSTFVPYYNAPANPGPIVHQAPTFVPIYQAQASTYISVVHQPVAAMPYVGMSTVPYANIFQATMLSQAFQTMTIQDPTWHMDTGASSYLAENTGFPEGSTSSSLRLGHPGDDVLRNLASRCFISFNSSKESKLCHACQLGRHVKLPFYSSDSCVESVFDIIHSDLWTSPFPSVSGIKYYAIFLDHFSYYLWVYPLHHKSNLFAKFVEFRAFVNKKFNVDIKSLQCDHGGEFDNTRFHTLFRQHGIDILIFHV
ncbi:ribonuclease H-like domain-containing protein [Tanacetum coccineum]